MPNPSPRILLLVSLALPAAAAAGVPDRAPIVITTDCGADMDDQWAVAHAALSPRLRTLAVIGGFAPGPHDLGSADTARCARETLSAVGRLADVPVYEGAGGPLRDRATPSRNRGVDRLVRLARDFSPERRLVVLALGPATDVASALLIDPAIGERVEVVALAFDRYPEGGDGWNVRNDVAAWQALLDAEVPVTTASGRVALDHLNLARGESDAMMGGLGPPGAYLACLHATWLEEFGAVFAGETGGGDRWPVWDEAVVAVVLGLAELRELPRPALADDASFSFPNARSRAPYRWVGSVDRGRLLGGLVDLLGRLGSERDGRDRLAGRSRSAPGRQGTTASGALSPECVGWMCRRPCPATGGGPG